MTPFARNVLVAVLVIILVLVLLGYFADDRRGAGAQEATPTAEPTPWPQPPYFVDSGDADVNTSGNVDVIDLLQVAQNVGPAVADVCAVFERDEAGSLIALNISEPHRGSVIREC